jgi:3-phenylpropionate/cinnamic acid dioxygenase small subunit
MKTASPGPSDDSIASERLQIGRSVIEREAALVDEQRWDEWIELFTSDCEYWVPAWRHDGGLGSDPQRELSLIYYSSRAGLEDRVMRIRSRYSPAAGFTVRTTHLVSSVRLDQDAGTDGLNFKSSWATFVFLPRSNATTTFFGQAHYKLIFDNGRWLIASKKIIVQNDYIPTQFDIYCV